MMSRLRNVASSSHKPALCVYACYRLRLSVWNDCGAFKRDELRLIVWSGSNRRRVRRQLSVSRLESTGPATQQTVIRNAIGLRAEWKK